jgi:hypothetical protein
MLSALSYTQSMPCKFQHCCFQTYLPLRLAYAQTLHTFQGQTAGPTKPDQPPNSISCIICDPGTRLFESKSFYTLLSRITSLGNDKDKFSSAIYFISDNMTPARILDITHTQKGILYHNAFLSCQHFISYLDTHTHTSRLTIQQRQELFNWAKIISKIIFLIHIVTYTPIIHLPLYSLKLLFLERKSSNELTHISRLSSVRTFHVTVRTVSLSVPTTSPSSNKPIIGLLPLLFERYRQ